MSALVLLTGCLMAAADEGAPDTPATGWPATGTFEWRASRPLVAPAQTPGEHRFSVKDPSIVFHDGRWHVFVTVRGRDRSHSVEYLSFTSWDQADSAPRHVLTASAGYFCAPQVFYFTPHRQWYLICQASDESWTPKYQAAYATTADIAAPDSWSPLKPLGAQPADGKVGLDFWIICDEQKAHLFFTTLDGRLWREETTLAAFPGGWSKPVLAIRGDIFEAGHTYRLKGLDKYLTLVEAQGGHGWRYYKAYLADRLDGPWSPLAATKDKAFASMANVQHPTPRWTDSISHGELIRAGFDERLDVDPENLQFVFQGVLDKDRAGKPYGQIPWRLGILEPPTQARGQPSGEGR